MYVQKLLLQLSAVEIVQEAVGGRAIVVIAVNVNGGQLLDGLVGRVGEPCQQRIVLELGREQEIRVLEWRVVV